MNVTLAAYLMLSVLAAPADRWSCVDDAGVLRWQDNQQEIALFGVNYYTPFTADFEGVAALGRSHREVIDHDVAHFQRLKLDVIRLHVFDRQISDLKGNLVDNVHLDLFDYLVSVCKARGIYTVLTPIAWWHYHAPNGGFSSRFSMPQMTRDPVAWEAQRNYLKQFLNHVNPYTGVAYKNEPAVVAIELINEPLYEADTTVDPVTDYIESLASAVRSTGAPQPIFYNGWQQKEESVAKSSIDGCSFGWYPTGLVSGGCLRGNYLPLVDDYPQMRLDCLNHKAKIVYEFDAADVPGRVMYPAMARAFRSGGAQIATQFQYDPLPLAAYNYGWQTHYLNLAYAPGKTLSFAIAAEVFRRTSRLQSFPAYPHNTEFGPFRLAYEEDLSEMITEDTFLYANDTKSRPPAPDRLKRIAGVGRSPVVDYDGTGAYFLDQISEGVWRLEVYPDAVWVDDPFGPTSLQREVSRLVWKQHAMQIRLPILGDDFSCRPLAAGSAVGMVASEGRIVIEPGAYTLVRRGITSAVVVESDFYAPRPNHQDVAVWWQVPDSWREGTPLPIDVTVAGADVTEVRLHLDGELVQTLGTETPYGYRGVIPAEMLTAGEHRLSLEVRCTGGRQWVPPSVAEPLTVLPAHRVWQFTAEQPLPQRQGSAAGRLVRPRADVVGVHADSFEIPGSAVGFRVPAKAARQPGYDTIVVRARATQAATRRFELGLVQNDGRAYGTEVALYPQWGDLRIELSSLHPLWDTTSGQLDPTKLQQLSFLFGPWLDPDLAAETQGFEVQSVRFERQAPGRRLTVVPRDAPLPLFSVDRRDVRVQGQADRVVTLVPGSQPSRQAVRITTDGFGSAPACLSFCKAVSEVAKAWQDRLAECNTVVITARGTTADTNRLELVLLEEDSAPWGTEVALTPQWQKIAIPLGKLRFFRHWPHPANRGGSDDRLLPQQIGAINICFGAWLYGDQADRPHGIEIDSIVLEKR